MYRPRHARSTCPGSRAAVGTTLTALLLPLTLGGPAMAQEPATPTSTIGSAAAEAALQTTTLRISATPVGADARSSIGVRLLADGEGVSDAPVEVQVLQGEAWTAVAELRTNGEGLAVGALPLTGRTVVRAVAAPTVTRTGGTSPEMVVRDMQQTTMRLSATRTGADGKSRIGVRLLADGRAVMNGYIRLEVATRSGWTYAGRLLSNAQGLGVGALPFSRDTRLRATYAGSSTRTAGATPEVVVVASSTLGQRAVQIAAQQRGKPYRYGSAGPSSFDCSGFTTYVYKTRLGKSIPRTSAQQQRALPRIARSAKRPGDLLFFRTGGRVSHVGIYAGKGKMWAAPTTGDRVKLQSIYSRNYTVGRVG